MRKIIAGFVMAIVAFGVAIADEFYVAATKVESKDGKWVVTGKKYKTENKKKVFDEKDSTFTIDGAVKVFKGKVMFDKDTKKVTVEAGDAIETGFKDEAFKNVSDEKGKGVNLYLTTEGDKVTKVYLIKGGKKKAE